jgi:superfamily I DNA/RNA helicase
VRNQEAKDKIPDFLQTALCLTVYEAKGLEFEDVILFNFFEDSITSQHWNLLRDMEIHERPKVTVKNDFMEFEDLEIINKNNFTEEDKNGEMEKFIVPLR